MPSCINQYQKHVDHFDLTDNQKAELIHIVHHMMESFVERAFGDDPTQVCIEAKVGKDALIKGDVIGSEHHDIGEFSVSTTFNNLKGER